MTLRSKSEYTWGDVPYRMQRDCLWVPHRDFVFWNSDSDLMPYVEIILPNITSTHRVEGSWYKIGIRSLCLVNEAIDKIEIIGLWWRRHLERLRMWKKKHALAILQLTTFDEPDVTSMIAKYLTN